MTDEELKEIVFERYKSKIAQQRKHAFAATISTVDAATLTIQRLSASGDEFQLAVKNLKFALRPDPKVFGKRRELVRQPLFL